MPMYSFNTMSQNLIVHIVEDDPSTRRLLENLTSLLGYETAGYDNGDEAWDAFAVESPQIVISDWKMPGKDGLELCRRLRQMRAENYTYFILVTAQRRSRANLELALDAGVDDFLKKPIGSDEIWNRLRVAERILGFNRQVKTLESLIPICSYCKKVRNEADLWEQIEQYVNQRTGADFTHSICPPCIEKHVRPQMDAYKKEQKRNKPYQSYSLQCSPRNLLELDQGRAPATRTFVAQPKALHAI